MTTRTLPESIASRERISLPANLTLGAATLVVAERDRSLAFYRDLLGMVLLGEDKSDASAPVLALGAGRRTVLCLLVRPGIARLPRTATGLFHAAILLPTRAALAEVLFRLGTTHYPIGTSDHLVSEALYLDDPDGNGLEIYRDRPRDTWTWDGDQIRMATIPLDLQDVLSEIEPDGAGSAPLPDGTRLGHIHLRVADTDAADRFFRDVLGFDRVARMPRARFYSANGYHHHVGANSWESAGGSPRTGDMAGLVEWSLIVPDRTAIDAVAERLAAAGYASERQPDGAVITTDITGTRLVFAPARPVPTADSI